jgi:hypothetical protein
MEAAMDVIGETVVAIRGRLSSLPELEPEPDEQAAKEIASVAARMPNLISFILLFHDLPLLLRTLCNKDNANRQKWHLLVSYQRKNEFCDFAVGS